MPDVPEENPEQTHVALQPFHVEAAGAALLAFKEHGGALDAYISLAIIAIYLEGVLKLSPQQSFENMMKAYRLVRTDPNVLKAVMDRMNEVISLTKIWVPGSRARN